MYLFYLQSLLLMLVIIPMSSVTNKHLKNIIAEYSVYCGITLVNKHSLNLMMAFEHTKPK